MSEYVALLDGGRREEPLGVRETAPGVYAVTLRGGVHVVDAYAPDAATLSLLVDTASRTATLDRRGASVRVRVGSAVLPLEILDARRLRTRRAPRPARPEGRVAVTAPLPGRIARVLARVGEAVSAGQALVVLEALQMGNELRSPKDGTVVELHVQEGQSVEGNARLCAVE